MVKKHIDHTTINSCLINELSERIPQNKLSDKIAEILGYSRDAVYRRIRGEVPFTFNEAMQIAQKTGISLDKIVHPESENNVVFSLNYKEYSDNFINTYHKQLETSIAHFKHEDTFLNASMKLAYNIVPASFYLKYNTLAKFVIFKWMYQADANFSFDSLSKLILPEETHSLMMRRLYMLHSVDNNEYILDRHIFQSFVDDIKYFVRIGLITSEELHDLKNELYSMLSQIETIATTGMFPTGKRIKIYISEIDFNFCYSLFKSDFFEYSRVRLYDLDFLYTHDSSIYRMHSFWISTLKKYSILITQSGEIFRAKYFKQQREIVDALSEE